MDVRYPQDSGTHSSVAALAALSPLAALASTPDITPDPTPPRPHPRLRWRWRPQPLHRVPSPPPTDAPPPLGRARAAVAYRLALRYLHRTLTRAGRATLHHPATAPALAVALPVGLGFGYALINVGTTLPFLPLMPFAACAFSLSAWRGRRLGVACAVLGCIVWLLTSTYPREQVWGVLAGDGGDAALIVFDLVTLLVGALLIGWARECWAQRLAEERGLRQDLTAARNTREAFMATAAHELRTPLTVQRMVAQTQIARLRKQVNDAVATGEDVAALLKRIGELETTDAAVDRMIRVVNAMLTDAQIYNGRTVVQVETCDLKAVVEGAVERTRHLWPNRAIEVRAPAQGIWVRADPDRLFQVLDHLLHNAVKYSAETMPVRVLLYLCSLDAQPLAEVVVEDQGIGIAIEDQPRVWERFAQASGYGKPLGASSHLGLGLGLYLVRALIHQQGGVVGVRSAPGAGSSFWFRLPLAAEQQVADVPAAGTEA